MITQNKTHQLLLFFLMLGISISIHAQKKTIKKDSTKIKTDNLLDMQANVLTDIFGSNLDGNRDGKKLTYLQLLEKSDLPESQKKEYRNWYYLQSKDLSQKQKDSLAKALEIKIKESNKKH